MAQGSHSTRGSYPRVCFLCGERVVISHSLPLQFHTDAAGVMRSFHFDCAKAATTRGEAMFSTKGTGS